MQQRRSSAIRLATIACSRRSLSATASGGGGQGAPGSAGCSNAAAAAGDAGDAGDAGERWVLHERMSIYRLFYIVCLLLICRPAIAPAIAPALRDD